MGASKEWRELGMNRRIPRRDFLNGVAIGVGAAYATLRGSPLEAARADALQGSAASYPPALTGLRGHYPAAVEKFGPIERGEYARYPAIDVRTGEDYDLVIVGGGLSGLAAAYFWRRALGPNQRILILDNHDDFGGHAKRNEFTYNGRTFIGYGGTMSISTPYPYSYTARALIEELGIQVERNREFLARDAFEKLGLGPGTFFDKEHFGEDRLVAGTGRIPWDQFFAKAPLSEAARRDLIRIYSGKNPDYLAGLSVEQKTAKLAMMSYQDYLLAFAKMSRDALPFFMGQGGRNNKRVDTTPALEAARRGSVGFDGLESVAAVIVEPVLGEGGFVNPPRDFLQRLAAICRDHGVLLVADEVQTGFGRTGTLFACEQFGLEPDLLIAGKSIAGGLPLASVTGRAEIMDAAEVGGLGGTYGGNPLACEAALAILENYDAERLGERARAIGNLFDTVTETWPERFPLIGERRGVGAMRALELVRDRVTREPAREETDCVIKACNARGLIILSAGTYGNVVRLLVPLVATDQQVREGLAVLEAALVEVSCSRLAAHPDPA